MGNEQNRIILLSAGIIATAFIIVALLNAILNRVERKQERIESVLPEILREETVENKKVRVLIGGNYSLQKTHNKATIVTYGTIIAYYGEEAVELKELTIAPDHEWFQEGSVRIEPKNPGDKLTITSIERSYGAPSYRGSLELFSTAEGIVIVNELLLEEYLCAVVPSEMPASYELEALKAQAICARSYAKNHLEGMAYPEYRANVDDSVSFQVYNNVKEQPISTQAVSETAGQVLTYNGRVANTYFYSTSGGHSTNLEAWGNEMTEEVAYLKGVPIVDEAGEAYEKDLSWFRWRAEIPEKLMKERLELELQKELGELECVEVSKRGVGNVALELKIVGEKATATVETENKIRDALGFEGYEIEKQDGKRIESGELLPSGFFTLEKSEDLYIIEGSGYGHGIGMSQNGANELAKAGKTCEEILEFFYPGTKVE